jgi:hypothetical protein
VKRVAYIVPTRGGKDFHVVVQNGGTQAGCPVMGLQQLLNLVDFDKVGKA